MAHQSDPHLLVAHALHVKGFGTVEDLARLTGLAEPKVESQLIPMLEQGLAQFKEARGLWMPTAEGKQVAADLIARELKDAGVDEGMREAYPAFLALNEKFKELCGDWQLFPGEGDQPRAERPLRRRVRRRRSSSGSSSSTATRKACASRSPTSSRGTRPTPRGSPRRSRR